MDEHKNETIGPLVSLKIYDAFMIKFIFILIKYFQDTNAVFVKVLAHSISF